MKQLIFVVVIFVIILIALVLIFVIRRPRNCYQGGFRNYFKNPLKDFCKHYPNKDANFILQQIHPEPTDPITFKNNKERIFIRNDSNKYEEFSDLRFKGIETTKYPSHFLYMYLFELSYQFWQSEKKLFQDIARSYSEHRIDDYQKLHKLYKNDLGNFDLICRSIIVKFGPLDFRK